MNNQEIPDRGVEVETRAHLSLDHVNVRTRFHVHDLKFEAIFAEIKCLLQKSAIQVVLLKGPHLAHAFYDLAHERPYADLDILVKPGDFRKAAAILAANRFERLEEDGKNLATDAQTNHWMYRSRFGQMIELHRGFAGLERHAARLDAWFSRAVDFHYGQTPAKGLATEDLLCHLCIHIGKSFFYFIEAKHIRDLDVIIGKREVDWDKFIERCRETRSKAIAYYSLSAAMAQYGTPVPENVQLKLRPGKLRRLWLEKHLHTEEFPIYHYYSKGLEHARKRLTLPLLDGAWARVNFIVRAVWVKGLDIVLRISFFRRVWERRNG
jgi:hypothetical protein